MTTTDKTFKYYYYKMNALERHIYHLLQFIECEWYKYYDVYTGTDRYVYHTRIGTFTHAPPNNDVFTTLTIHKKGFDPKSEEVNKTSFDNAYFVIKL
jgi:hypothetical protein